MNFGHVIRTGAGKYWRDNPQASKIDDDSLDNFEITSSFKI
jgi:hypothetical protein